MRKLTEKGFMKRYLKALSNSDTSSVYKLIKEIPDNPRLVEPLAYFCIITDVSESVCKKNNTLHSMWIKMQSGEAESEINKILSTYKYEADKKSREDNLKRLICRKTVKLMEDNSITKYQVYNNLSLDPSNVNAYLKHCNCDRVTLNTAREILNYVSALSL